MQAPLVVFFVGNPSRGDDALGPMLAERLTAWLERSGRAAEVCVIEDFQLNIEHALDLRDRRLALFVDAGEGTSAPCWFSAAVPAEQLGHATHAMSPEAVLRVFMQTEGGLPPPAFVLAVRGDSFELGEDLSPAARLHLEAAWEWLMHLLNEIDPVAWAAWERQQASVQQHEAPAGDGSLVDA